MSIQTINNPKGVGYTRYVLSSAQRIFLHRLQHWMMNNTESLYTPDPQLLIHYKSVVYHSIKNNGYNEDDAPVLNHLRTIYIRYKDTLPF